MLPHILLSRLTPYAEEIIGDHQCGFRRNRSPYFLSFFFHLPQQPPVGQGLLIHEVSRSRTTTHCSRYDSFVRVISSSQRPLSYNTQHSQQTSMPSVGFEPTFSAGERPQTYAVDRAATGTGQQINHRSYILHSSNI